MDSHLAEDLKKLFFFFEYLAHMPLCSNPMETACLLGA